MWNPDGHRTPSWVEDAYEVLAPEIREHGDGMPRDDAKTVLTDREELEVTPTDATHAVDQLLDRGYLYEVDGDLYEHEHKRILEENLQEFLGVDDLDH